ncbi:MAG: GtrA family protein [Kiritimatiellae bacterium]|nr:GtrA family protein [Kiritimatiellia bacterium]
MDGTPKAPETPAVPFPKTVGEFCRQFTGDGASAHPFIQFVKYAFAGGIATASHILTFFLAGFFLFPCVAQDDILVRLFHLAAPAVDEALRARNAVFCNGAAFVVSNVVCYIANRLFVFKPGRHGMVVEFLLFVGVSAISAGLGTFLMGLLIDKLAVQTTYAFGANLVCSLAINYVLRKFFVFDG